MKKVNVSEAKASLGHILADVKQGESYIICERNVPVATLKALEQEVARGFKVGKLKNQFTIPDDFDDAVKEFEQDFYGE